MPARGHPSPARCKQRPPQGRELHPPIEASAAASTLPRYPYRASNDAGEPGAQSFAISWSPMLGWSILPNQMFQTAFMKSSPAIVAVPPFCTQMLTDLLPGL